MKAFLFLFICALGLSSHAVKLDGLFETDEEESHFQLEMANAILASKEKMAYVLNKHGLIEIRLEGVVKYGSVPSISSDDLVRNAVVLQSVTKAPSGFKYLYLDVRNDPNINFVHFNANYIRPMKLNVSVTQGVTNLVGIDGNMQPVATPDFIPDYKIADAIIDQYESLITTHKSIWSKARRENILIALSAAIQVVADAQKTGVYQSPSKGSREIVRGPSPANRLQDVKDFLKILKQQGVKSEQVLTIFDVDGTLTNHSNPTRHAGSAEPREDAGAFIQELMDMGVYVVVSSAWNNFAETIRRLEDLGLEDTLKVNKKTYKSGVLKFDVGGKKYEYSYTHSGHAASVLDFDLDWKYYRGKAMSYKLVYPNLDVSKIKYVVFADDSSRNINYFEKHVKLLNLFPNSKVHLFKLSSVYG